MKNNCELVIATDLECKNHKVLYKGSYNEISNITTKYDSSLDIRRIYKKDIDSFLFSQKEGEKGDIVIIEAIKCDHGINYNRLKVLYKEDKIVAKYLLKSHDIKSDFSMQWLYFWDNMVNCKKYEKMYRSIDPFDSEEIKEAKREINDRIHDCDEILKQLSYQFKKYLSDYHRYNWDPLASSYHFIKCHFNPFKKFIKEKNCEAEIMNIVLKAFDIYCKRCKLLGKKYISSKDIINLYNDKQSKNIKSNDSSKSNDEYKDERLFVNAVGVDMDVKDYIDDKTVSDELFENYENSDNLRRTFQYSKKPIMESNGHSKLYNQIQNFLNNGGIIEEAFDINNLLLYSSLTKDEFDELSLLKQESRYVL